MTPQILKITVLLLLAMLFFQDQIVITIYNETPFNITMELEGEKLIIPRNHALETAIPFSLNHINIMIRGRTVTIPVNGFTSRQHLYIRLNDNVIYAIIKPHNLSIDIKNIEVKTVRYVVGSGLLLQIYLNTSIINNTSVISSIYCTSTRCVDIRSITTTHVEGNHILLTINVEKAKLPFIDVINNSVNIIVGVDNSYIALLYSHDMYTSRLNMHVKTITNTSKVHESMIINEFYTITSRPITSNHENIFQIKTYAQPQHTMISPNEELLLIIAVLVLIISTYVSLKISKGS
mgnify:CR=1 FL=1